MNDIGDFKDLETIVACLKSGKIVLYPTDTIWGIGCDATNEHAIQRIFQLKRRPKQKAMIVLVDSIERLQSHTGALPQELLAELMHTVRPLTVIYPKVTGLPGFLLAEDGSLAIRVVQDAYCMAMIAELDRPLVSTSANLSGEQFDGSFGSIAQKIVRGVDYASLYRRALAPGKPSRIIRFDGKSSWEVIRP